MAEGGLGMVEKIRNKANFEKATSAMKYLEVLTKEGFTPLFKGGTCAQLFIPSEFQRLSIDLDIASSNERELAEAIELTKKKGYSFERWKKHPDPNLPLIRYTITSPEGTDFYLDEMLKVPAYKTQTTKLNTSYFSSDATVLTPTLQSMIGDKLTTIGPHTVGRELNARAGAIEYAKHIYDISQLLALPTDIDEVFKAYVTVVDYQKAIRPKRVITIENSIEDLLYVARLLAISGQDGKTMENKEMAQHMQYIKNGIQGIGNFLIGDNKFGPNHARVAGGQIALIGMALKKLSTGGFSDYAELKKKAESKPDDERFLQEASKQLIEVEPLIEWKRLQVLTPRSIPYWYFAYFSGNESK
jgi:hypothetical protein